MSEERVVRLVDRVGVSVDGHSDLCAWLRSWTDSFERGDYGEFRSLVLVIESEAGELATIAQSLGRMDMVRCAGLLMAAAHRKLDGNTGIERLEQAS